MPLLQESPIFDRVRYRGILGSIGQTPLLRLRQITADLPSTVQIYAKAENLNPGGSVKDRAAREIILEAERTGELTSNKTILDATSGNTGIAYAMIGAALGYRVALCLPQNASLERKHMLRVYGAEIIETDPLLGTDGAQAMAKELFAQDPDRYFYADQYNNPNNWGAHYDTTAPEIWAQTKGAITHFIAGLGTSGTFVGTTRRLKEIKPTLQAISVQPDSPMHGLEGMKHMPTAVVPGIYDPTLADRELEIGTEDSQRMCLELAKKEGLFVGVSSGANVLAALRIARTLRQDAVVVTILCDSGSRYFSDLFWKDELKA